MRKREANWNVILNQYLRQKKMYCFYELKQTTAETFPFSKIETVQWEGLQATEENGLVWKFSDEGSRPKPCDGACIPPLPSYLVIKFKTAFYFIRFSKIIEMSKAGATSICRSKAEEVSEKIIKIS